MAPAGWEMRPEWTTADAEALTKYLGIYLIGVDRSRHEYTYHREGYKLLIREAELSEAMLGSVRFEHFMADQEHPEAENRFAGLVVLSEFFGKPLRDMPLLLHEYPEIARWRLKIGK
jgi:hypothetical protein